MPSLSRSAVKVILRYISDRSDKGDDEARKLLPYLSRRAGIKKTLAEPSRKSVKKAKRETRREKVAGIREAVRARAAGWCEVPGCYGPPAEMDHFRGGSLRRILESVEGCWLLCPGHHREKTQNWPSRDHWDALFEGHCQVHGFAAPSRFRREPKGA